MAVFLQFSCAHKQSTPNIRYCFPMFIHPPSSQLFIPPNILTINHTFQNHNQHKCSSTCTVIASLNFLIEKQSLKIKYSFMKKIFFLHCLIMLSIASFSQQIPKGMKYQGVTRDLKGLVPAEQKVISFCALNRSYALITIF